MFSPWITLDLVHAVQKPLVVPALANMRPICFRYTAGATFAIPFSYAAHLSTVVQSEIVQLPPERWVKVIAPVDSPGTYSVHLGGGGPSGSERRDVRLDVQTLAPGADEDLGWDSLEGIPPADTAEARSDTDLGPELWQRAFDLPADIPGGTRVRIMVEEYETYGSEKRLVFAEAIKIRE